ncbi:MAG: hypothetical protein ACRDDW_02550 [Candidatus Rhabdochlamydia sp.]
MLRREFFQERHDIHHNKKELVYIDFTQHEKAIIQQQATRGCTAATAAMLIKDRGGELDFDKLEECNLGVNKEIEQDIKNAGFNPVSTSCTFESLREQLLKCGSAIVSIDDPQAGGHSIIIDEMSEDLKEVRLRDPYHGWEITVTAEALKSRWHGNQDIIQIK